MADLEARIGKLRLENPTMLASGILGQTGESMLRVIREGGAGAVVTKSIGLEPRVGHEMPCLVELDGALLNAMGLPNPGIEEFAREMRDAVTGGAPVIGSIFADTGGKLAALASRMEEYGASAVELNLSCPHASGYGLDIGTEPDLVRDVVAQVRDAVGIPVWAKLSPMVPDMASIALAAQEAGADAVVAINTLKAMSILPETGRPVLGHATGGLSGPAVRPVGVRAVYEIAGQVDIPVIGVGGIITGRDALEYLMAGASAVQIGSGIRYRGIDVFRKVCREIGKFMDSRGYSRLDSLIGIAQEDGV